MKSETIFKRDIKWTFIYPFFTAETKKEEKMAKRMNGFFTHMGEVIEKYTSSDAFPEGGKFTAECDWCEDSTLASCRFILKQRGRVRYRRNISYEWEKGYVKKSNIM